MASLASLCKQRIAKNPGYENWIAKYVTVEYVNDQAEARFRCIAHSEEKSSCHFNCSTGLWKCQSGNCGAAGDAIDFYFYVGGFKTKAEAIHGLAVDLGIIANLTDSLILELCDKLYALPQVVEVASQQLGVSADTLRRFKIGLWRNDQTGETRFTIPIKGESGAWEDIRKYNRRYEPKIKSWAAGHGACRVFLIDVLRAFDTVFLFEGEKDCMRAHEFGIGSAISFTGGAGSMPENSTALFRGKTVYVCYDIDKAGVEKGENVAVRLACAAKEVFVISLPREGLPENGDFSDWANLNPAWAQWEQLVRDARLVEPQPGQRFEEQLLTQEPTEVEFKDLLINRELYNRPVRFLARALGASVGLPNYQVPSMVLLDCSLDQKGLCKACALYNWDKGAKPWTAQIDYRTEKSLQLFRCTDEQQGHAIRKIFGINHRCNVLSMASSHRHPIQHLLLSNPCELNQMRETYQGEYTAYYHGEPFTDNRDYWFEGYVQADPKNQGTVLNIMSARPARNAIESFEINEDVVQALDWFACQTGETISEHIAGLHSYIEQDIGIWGQHAMQQAFLEAIFSVLRFRVGSREIENGWVEILLIGDTGLAKSTVALRMMRMINVGEYLNGETVSAAGIIGGIEYRDKVAVMKWGAFPRNDQGFVVLDEVSAMQKRHRDVTGQLTAMRSTGIAKITKIVDAETPARVRTVWITNPEDCKQVASYNGACRAISGVVQDRADVARFTKAYAVAAEGVTIDTITQQRQRMEHPIIRKHWNTLAILTWSLKPDQIIFTDGAQAYLRDQARVLTEKYHESIPLLEKGRALDKLAKLSIPIAVLCGNFRTSEDKLALYVGKGHCQYAVEHLQATYDDSAMGYDSYSMVEYERERIKNQGEVKDSLIKCTVMGDLEDTLRFFLIYNTVSRNAFREFIANALVADETWATLLRNNCLVLGRNLDTATKTAAFASLLEQLLAEWQRDKANAKRQNSRV